MSSSTQPPETHPGALALRRQHAGESMDAAHLAHVAACGECQSRLAGFTREQKEFEAALPFERFAAGVERAAREEPRATSPRWLRPLMSLAAVLVAAVGVTMLRPPVEPMNRLKGGVALEVVVAGPAGQRSASGDAAVPEALKAGERVRLGVTPGPYSQVLVLSVDQEGAVSPVYERGGASLPVTPGAATAWLPDSLEFTGHGLERLVVVLSETPISVDDASARAREALTQSGGEVRQLPRLALPGEQFHRSFLKP